MRFLSKYGSKVVLLLFVFFALTGSFSQAFLYQVEVLDDKTIDTLSDEALLETYINVLIELEASTTFSKAAGFNQNEYAKYKKILRFRVELMQEIQQRGLDVPKITP